VLAEATNGDDVPTELGEWTTVWGLPGDCLRWLPWRANHEFGFSGVREGRFLLTGDIDAPTIRYIADLTDYARWSPGMREALAGKLAMWLASAAPVQSQTSARKAAEIYDDALSRGRRMDGLETNDREGDAMGRSNWLAARESFGADCD
jgi:hypothetical protein